MDENNREYTNGEITVYWRPKECVHATTCFRELRAVFNPGKRPWVDLSAAPTDEIIRVIGLCPTNALSYKWNKDLGNATTAEEKPVDLKEIISSQTTEAVEIRVMENGPLVIKGNFVTLGEDGKELKKMKIASFCRCGQSNNMPYCDGMHRKIGWFSR